MSTLNPVPPASPQARPGVVSAAGYLLFAAAALYVVSQIISLSYVGRVMDAVQTSNAQLDQSARSSLTDVVVVVTIILGLLVAALFAVLGAFVLRGRNGMRIATWVIAGIGALCTLCGVIGGGLSPSSFSSLDNSNPTTVSVQDAVPGWARAVSILINVVMLIILITVIILLALPASNAYFRRVEPMMIVGYPPYPAYPGYPGASSYGQIPPQGVPGASPYPDAPLPPPPPASPWAAPGGTSPASDNDPNHSM